MIKHTLRYYFRLAFSKKVFFDGFTIGKLIQKKLTAPVKKLFHWEKPQNPNKIELTWYSQYFTFRSN